VLVQPILAAAFVIAADRSSKTAAANLLGSGKVLSIGNGLRVRCVVTRFRNRGFLDRPAMLLLVWAAALAIIALAISSGMFFQRPLAQMGPVSNLADIALVLGIAIALRFI
jgi:hypothetical protein